MGTAIISFLCICLLLGAIVLGMWGCPQYNVWQQGLAGEAEFKRAEQNRKIAVQEALAKKEAAALLSSADSIRAIGVANANRIIGTSLHENEDYLRWLWIDGLHNKEAQIIYVPTEAGLPILEASKR